MNDLAITLLVGAITVAVVLGIFFALFGTKLTKDESARKRLGYKDVKVEAVRVDEGGRRRSIEKNLKDLDERRKARKNASIQDKIQRAGKTWSSGTYQLTFLAAAIVIDLLLIMMGYKLLMIVCVSIVIGLGLPRFILSYLIKKREKAFLEQFPSAIDVLVRGVRTGLPINECLNVIAKEIPEPVAGEFKRLTESLSLGVSMDDALMRMFDRLPLPEINFFAVVLIIQKQTGGNLAEALGNLSNVLRERKKLGQKIKALSAEAKASASVIGSLPFIVAAMVHVVTPGYLDPLFFEPMGNFILAGAAIWMSCGILVMRGMMNFRV